MTKLFTALAAILMTGVAQASCWVVPGHDTVSQISMEITTGPSSQTFLDINPKVPGNQSKTLQCIGFVDTKSGAESISCYDDGGDLGIWVIYPDIANRDKGVGFLALVPTFRQGEIINLPIKFDRCSIT